MNELYANILKEFYLQDTETQYEIVKKVKNKMRDKKIKKYLEVFLKRIISFL